MFICGGKGTPPKPKLRRTNTIYPEKMVFPGTTQRSRPLQNSGKRKGTALTVG